MKRINVFLLLLIAFFLSKESVAGDVKILTNHLGYETTGPKHAVVIGKENNKVTLFKIKELSTDKEIFVGVPDKKGPVYRWKDWYFWTIDFDKINKRGTYYIECLVDNRKIKSFPFSIQIDILERNTISNIIYYFKSQRCSGLLDKADRNIKFCGLRHKRIDVHGGWFDATGDYGKHLSHLTFSTYFNPQQTPLAVWSLFKAYNALAKRKNSNYCQYKRRLLDEAMYGADYLIRIKGTKGSFYRSISGRGSEKAPKDRCITPRMKSFSIKTPKTKNRLDFRRVNEVQKQNIYDYEVGYRSGGGVAIAALAMASTFKVSGDFTNSDYLKVAEEAFSFLEKNNLCFTNDGKENIIDDYCALTAATELYKATGKDKYKKAANIRAENLLNRQISRGNYKNYWRADDGDRPFFHATDAGFPVVSLLYYLDIADENMKRKVLETVKKSLEFELKITGNVTNPFGYARQYVQNKKGERWDSFFYPHDTDTAPWWQGENGRLASLAAAARIASKYIKDKKFCAKLESYAMNQLNWILGLNPYDSCMLHGTGRNNPVYMYFGSYEYTNCPGGICNGITAGFNDRNGIDFQIPFSVTGEDDDWRWEEQWLPHASWFLLAVAVGK